MPPHSGLNGRNRSCGGALIRVVWKCKGGGKNHLVGGYDNPPEDYGFWAKWGKNGKKWERGSSFVYFEWKSPPGESEDC